MPGQGGQDILVQVNTGTVGVPVWTTIAGQRDATITHENDLRDVSSKDARARRVQAARYSSEVSCDYLYSSPGVVEALTLETAVAAGTIVQLRRWETPAAGGAAVAKGIASAVVSSWKLSATDQEEGMVSAEFGVDGAWT